MAYKKYLTLRLEECLQKKKAFDNFLIHSKKFTNKSEELLVSHPEYQKLISPYFQSVSFELAQWVQEEFETNPKYPEQLIHKTISGIMVRSKSETLIDMMLHMYQIPFRYECALDLGEVTLYPDFTIRHPKTGVLYYWEHFGMMDDPYYYRNAFSKLQLFATAGIIPGIQLITTYETREHPLTTKDIEFVIKQYFLD